MEEEEMLLEKIEKNNIVFASFKKQFQYTDSSGNKREAFIYIRKGDINIEFPEDLYWFNSIERFWELIKKKKITFSPETKEEITELWVASTF
ncbi:MAG: hypothetical protein ABRQ39_27610 [Candidatus Eremiobacterota bacterium]